MSKLYNKSETAIRKHAHQIGFDIKQLRQGKLSYEDKQIIINSYYTKTSTELAKQFNVSRGMITKLWKDNNLFGKESRQYVFEKQDYFHTIDTEEKAYFLGFIAADGCIYKPKDGRQIIIRIGIVEKDIEILENFRQAIKTNKPIQHQIGLGNKQNTVALELSSDQMGEDLINLGIVPCKSYLQTWVNLSYNSKIQNAFIRGYFEGDGSISSNFDIHNLHSVGITISGYKSNLLNFAKYLLKQGISSVFIEDKRENKYTLQTDVFGSLTFVNKINKIKFLELIYPQNCSLYLTRKFILSEKFKNLCELNAKTWTINNADNKLDKIGETLHYSWGNPEVTSQITQG